MIVLLMCLVLFGFGIMFRYYTKETQFGWLTWAIPLGLYAFGVRADLGESAMLLLYPLVFGIGALCFGAGFRLHSFCGARQ